MKILHVSSAIDWRGGEQQIVYLAEELSKIEDVYQVVLCPRDSVLEEKTLTRGIPVKTFSKGFFHHLVLAFTIKKICSSEKFDCIHIHDAHSHTSAIIAASLLGNKTKLILSRKVDFKIKQNWFSRFKYNHENITAIICVSKAVKSILEFDITNKNIKLRVIYDGIDTSRFSKPPSGIIRSKFNLGNNQLLIGNVAAIAPHKDYFTFIDTAEICRNEKLNAKFIIVGDGPLRTDITNYILKKGLEEYVLMVGFIQDIESVLPELDIFLFTSKTEGLGSSILDAYLSKVPVVATRAGGIPEIVIEKETGLLADISNPIQLATHLNTIISDINFRNQLIINGSTFVQQFAKQQMAIETLKCYKSQQ